MGWKLYFRQNSSNTQAQDLRKVGRELGISETKLTDFMLFISELKLAVLEQKAKLDAQEQEMKHKLAMLEMEKRLAEFRVHMLQKELLMTKGTLTARGIFEHMIGECGKELFSDPMNPSRKPPSIAAICDKLHSFLIKNETLTDSYPACQNILTIFRECELNTDEYNPTKLWVTLCNEVHGAPWSGPAVMVRSSRLHSKESCVIMRIAKSMHLSIED